jgi:hypothetical protein
MELLQAKNDINLRVLKRHDNTIESIVETCAHCVLYQFIQNQWIKKQTEGTLFLYKKSGGYGMMILNRISLTDFCIAISKDFQYQQSGEYLMFKQNEEINGLWIFGEESRKSLFLRLEESVLALETTQLSFDEVWSTLESMAPFENQALTEHEFVARFSILVQNPYFLRAMYSGYLYSRRK